MKIRRLQKNKTTRSIETEKMHNFSEQDLKGVNVVNWDTGRLAIVLGAKNQVVKILHQSGRITKKQRHYFNYDFYLAY